MQPRPIREARSAKTPCGACGWDGRYPGVLGWLPGLFGDVAEGRGAVPEGSEGNGYSTAAVGKWHLTPEKEQGPAGPFDHWPNAWGFDYYWGFLAPEAGQFDTMIAENQKFIGVQEGRDGKPFYFPEAMTDQRSIGCTAFGATIPKSLGVSTTRLVAAMRPITSGRSGRRSTRAGLIRGGTSPAVRAAVLDAVEGQIGLPVFAIDVLVDGVTATSRRDRRASVTFRTRRRSVAKSAQIVGPYSGAGSSKE